MTKIRPIDADALKLALSQSYNDPEQVVDGCPTLDYAPVRHGEWDEFDDGFDDTTFECSLCKVVWWSDAGSKAYRYCPNCGARMDGGKGNV